MVLFMSATSLSLAAVWRTGGMPSSESQSPSSEDDMMRALWRMEVVSCEGGVFAFGGVRKEFGEAAWL